MVHGRLNHSSILADTLRHLVNERNSHENGKETNRLRRELISIYMEVRDVKLVKDGYPARVLRKHDRRMRFPNDDHGGLFGHGYDYIWTSQPYGHEVAEIVVWAHQHDLEVTISPEWGWHYPGRAPLIEWRRSS